MQTPWLGTDPPIRNVLHVICYSHVKRNICSPLDMRLVLGLYSVGRCDQLSQLACSNNCLPCVFVSRLLSLIDQGLLPLTQVACRLSLFLVCSPYSLVLPWKRYPSPEGSSETALLEILCLLQADRMRPLSVHFRSLKKDVLLSYACQTQVLLHRQTHHCLTRSRDHYILPKIFRLSSSTSVLTLTWRVSSEPNTI